MARLREIYDGDSDFDAPIWNGLCEMGVAGLLVPEAYGGAGMELLDLALVMEVLGAGAVPSPLFGHALATLAIVLGGSEEQKERYLPALAEGSDVQLKALAKQDMAKPTSATDQVKLADGWWSYGERQPDYIKDALRARAILWYKTAMPNLDGLAKVKVQRRIQAAPAP